MSVNVKFGDGSLRGPGTVCPSTPLTLVENSVNLQSSFYSWHQFSRDCALLAKLILESPFKPELIVGLARGGWFPASQIAHFLETSATLQSIHVETRPQKDISLPAVNLKSCDVVLKLPKYSSVLVVDDVCDSGRTLKYVLRYFFSEGVDVRSAVLHFKPQSSLEGYTPDFYASVTDAWIIYPWEVKHE